MKKILENAVRLETRNEYILLNNHIEYLIKEATEGGYLSEADADNEYTRELGRLAHLCHIYEKEFITFSFEQKTPLIQSIESEMAKRGLKQKEIAEMIGINEPSLSSIMRGKRSVSMQVAKKLYKVLNIDPRLIVEYS